MISVIIPVRKFSESLPVLDCLKKMDYLQDKIEIIVAEGNFPSLQRNKAARVACGDILYFLNFDSCPGSNLFNKVVEIFNRSEDIAGVGGPDLTPKNNTYLQQTFGLVLSSYFAHWKMRARYSCLGKERVSNERELILSNLAIRKDVFLQFKGFDERFYPNEENEFINRIVKTGLKFIYSPDAKIYRDRRKTAAAFMKQFYQYGRGRMRQVSIEGLSKNFLFLLPVFFLFYLTTFAFVKGIWVRLVPLFIYLFIGIIDSIYLSFLNKRVLVFSLPLLYFLMHLSYALGMVSEFIRLLIRSRPDKKDGIAVKVRKIKSLEDNFAAIS